MSNMSRRKGARVENDIAHAIQRHGIPADSESIWTWSEHIPPAGLWREDQGVSGKLLDVIAARRGDASEGPTVNPVAVDTLSLMLPFSRVGYRPEMRRIRCRTTHSCPAKGALSSAHFGL